MSAKTLFDRPVVILAALRVSLLNDIFSVEEIGESKPSRYTVSPPSANKWHTNAAALSRVLPGLQDTIELIRTTASELPHDEFSLSIEGVLE